MPYPTKSPKNWSWPYLIWSKSWLWASLSRFAIELCNWDFLNNLFFQQYPLQQYVLNLHERIAALLQLAGVQHSLNLTMTILWINQSDLKARVVLQDWANERPRVVYIPRLIIEYFEEKGQLKKQTKKTNQVRSFAWKTRENMCFLSFFVSLLKRGPSYLYIMEGEVCIKFLQFIIVKVKKSCFIYVSPCGFWKKV